MNLTTAPFVATFCGSILVACGFIPDDNPHAARGPGPNVAERSAKTGDVRTSALVEAPAPAKVRRDADEIARLAGERVAQIGDFRCIFLKRERIGGKLRDEETIEVAFRDRPTTVYMIWKKNAVDAKRALYIDSAEMRNHKGVPQVRVEPAGAVARMFVADTKIDLHGDEAHNASRRGMDEFGFKALMKLLGDYNDLARKEGTLDFKYEGEGLIDGRPTYLLARRLPFQGDGGRYPDALMRMHIDQEWMIPTAVYSYADAEGQTLLGSYVYTQVNLNPKLTDADFKF